MKRAKRTQLYLLLAAIVAVVAIAGCRPLGADTVAPTVSSTIPADAATDVSINGSIIAMFSEAMEPSTITAASFTVQQGTTPVTGAVAYTGTTATFTPESNFAVSTEYTVTIAVEAEDVAGNALESSYVWTFTTGTIPDTTGPAVVSTVPVDAAIGVATSVAITATFSEAMAPLSFNTTTFSVVQGTTPVAGTVSYIGNAATFTPTDSLQSSTLYTVRVTTGVMDLAGNALIGDEVWVFTTADTVPPTVILTSPINTATDVAVNSTVRATFSEPMNPATIITATFTLTRPGPVSVPGVVTYNVGSRVATFAPTAVLLNNTTYTATVTIGAADLGGNALIANKVWTFKTIAAVATGPAPVLLGAAANYAILAETGITNISPSAITGDVAVSPAAASTITGFALVAGTGFATAAEVTGFVYAADMAPPTPANLTTAVANMVTAYTDAATRPAATGAQLDVGAGTIGAATPSFAPDLYTWTTAVSIAGNITISGTATDVWIFQIPGALTVDSAVSVVLSGGAQAKNIFWQVAGAVSLGTTSHFEGIILGGTAITMGTGASLNGRAFAQTLVALDSDTIVEPAP